MNFGHIMTGGTKAFPETPSPIPSRSQSKTFTKSRTDKWWLAHRSPQPSFTRELCWEITAKSVSSKIAKMFQNSGDVAESVSVWSFFNSRVVEFGFRFHRGTRETASFFIRNCWFSLVGTQYNTMSSHMLRRNL